MWSPTWTETGGEKPLEMMWEKLIQEPLWFVQCFPSPCSTWERKTIWEGDKWVAQMKNSTQIQGFVCSSFLCCPPVVSPGPVQARVVSQNRGHAGRMVSQQFVVHRLGRAGVEQPSGVPPTGWESMDESTAQPLETFSHEGTEWNDLDWERI